MARWYLRKGGRYYRYGRFRGWKRGGYRKRYGYSRKYVNATSRSSIRMKTVVTSTFNCTAGHYNDARGASVYLFCPYEQNTATLSAANSPLYRTYCSLYEEVKVIGVKVNIAVVSAVGGADIPSVQIYSAWDRKYGRGEPIPTKDSILASATSTVATALNNNVAKLTRSCFASDLIEKATWIDASLDADNGNRNVAWYTAGTNPNMFCPAFAMFLNCPSRADVTAVSCSFSVTYYFGFRNPRYGGISTRERLQALGPAYVAAAEADGDGGGLGDAAAEVPDDPGDMDDAVPIYSELTRVNDPSKRQSQREAEIHSRRMARVSDPVLGGKNF